MAFFHHNSLCPWVTMVDRPRYAAAVAALAGLGAETIASSHSPVIPTRLLDRAFELLAGLPDATSAPLSSAGAERIAGQASPVP